MPGLCVSVCVSVPMFSATTYKKTAKKRCQQVQRFTGLFLKLAKYCVQELYYENQSEQANMLISVGLCRPHILLFRAPWLLIQHTRAHSQKASDDQHTGKDGQLLPLFFCDAVLAVVFFHAVHSLYSSTLL